MDSPNKFRIERGIGQYDYNDYYAVLGLPITASSFYLRKRYITIAKTLHPDVIYGYSPEEKRKAIEYLSKLVNPAYHILSQDRERTEYAAILKLLGKRLIKRNQKFLPYSDIAKQYLEASHSINYEQTVQSIAQIQYQNLDKTLDYINQLSELNLVHILLQEGYSHSPSIVLVSKNSSSNSTAKTSSSDNARNTNAANQTFATNNGNGMASKSYQSQSESKIAMGRSSVNSATSSSTANNSQNNNQTSQTNQARGYQANSSQVSGQQPLTSQSTNNQSANLNSSQPVSYHITQAEEYINKQLWSSALRELRIALQSDPKSSKCHALLGYVYLNQKLLGMAKTSFKQALAINPKEELALKYINQVDANAANKDSKTEEKKQKKGGFFGWLGGG